MEWEKSTEGAFIKGDDLPQQGVQLNIISIRQDQMDRRDGTGKEVVFIARFHDDQELVLNKTNRKFLFEECGLTNANISAFSPFTLLLVPNHTTMGTGTLLRRVAAVPVAGAPVAAPPLTPPVVDDVPF